VSLAVLETIT